MAGTYTEATRSQDSGKFAATGAENHVVVEIDFSNVEKSAASITQIFEGSVAGIIVRGVVEPTTASELIRCIAADDSLPSFRPPVFKGCVYGRPLVSASNGLGGYLDDAQRFRTRCTEIFPDYGRIEQRIGEALAALGGGRSVRVPRDKDDRPYLTATIRALIEGDRLPLHYENETLRSPAMAALSPLLDQSTLMSFYLPLAVPPAGGILRLFHTHCLSGGDSLINRLGGEERARPEFEARGFQVITPGVGDLLVFDGGRWYHDVTPIEGGSRWTLGGFLALTRDRDAVLYWS